MKWAHMAMADVHQYQNMRSHLSAYQYMEFAIQQMEALIDMLPNCAITKV